VKNKLQLVEEISLEKDKEYKYLSNTPQEFLVPRINFKTEQVHVGYYRSNMEQICWKTIQNLSWYTKLFYKIISRKRKAIRNNCQSKYLSFTPYWW